MSVRISLGEAVRHFAGLYGRLFLVLAVLAAGLALKADQLTVRAAPADSSSKTLTAPRPQTRAEPERRPAQEVGIPRRAESSQRMRPEATDRGQFIDMPRVLPWNFEEFLSTLPSPRCTREDLLVEFSVDKNRYEPGEPVRMSGRVHPIARNRCAIVRSYRSHHRPVEVMVQDPDGAVVWRADSCGGLPADLFTVIVWAPDHDVVFEVAWDQHIRRRVGSDHSCPSRGRVPPGKYTATVIFSDLWAPHTERERIEISFCIDPVALPAPASLKDEVWSAPGAPGANVPCLAGA